ncbi:MAG: C4-dicarboxylate transporter DctA [Planctomycetes bacterium]|nr:C4-dicarboxylate transporter DctA [Planctomycetota bacterium]
MSDIAAPGATRPSRAYLYVLVGVVAGVAIGYFWPHLGAQLKPVSDAFIGLVKMMIAPVIFCTVVLGIAGMSDLRKLGRVGGKALLYFEVVSTLALLIGLVVATVLQPGAGVHADPAKLDAKSVADYAQRAHEMSFKDYLLHLIPKTFIEPFASSGDLLQVLLVAILFGIALAALGPRGQPLQETLGIANRALFGVVGMIMKLAPLGAGAAMAFTVGNYGVEALKSLAVLVGIFYLTCAIFVVVVLGAVARVVGFSVLRFIAYIKDEILTVLGTSSSESALVPLMGKLETLGCPQSVVGVVVPAGYSFNLDGTNIYMTLATLFVAQALEIHLDLGQQLTIIGVAMLTSKGASGVTGAGFVTLSATLAVVPGIPVEGLALILGVDRFMSEARAVTNFIGNGVATLAMAHWEGELDVPRLRVLLAGRPGAPAP